MKTLPDWLETIEKFVDRSIPFMGALLTFIIILEFTKYAEQYHDIILAADYLIIIFFVTDLIFKWYHTRKVSKFIKLYWIDIIAVFPFYLIFRMYIVTREIITVGEQAQKFLHEAVLAREIKLFREVGTLPKIARQGRIIRLFARSLRILRARWYIVHWHLQKLSKGYRKTH